MLQNIYNYFMYDQSRLWDMFVQERLPGASESLDVLVKRKLLKKKDQPGGGYYISTGKFEEAMNNELNRRNV